MIGDSSNSGIIAKDFENRSRCFTDITEEFRTTHNVLLKAKRNGHWWLLKGLIPEEADQPVYQEMLRKESEMLMRVQVPGHSLIVKTTGLESVPGWDGLFLVMEWVDGRTLKEFLKNKPAQTMKQKIARELIDVVSYLHSLDIVHRDLKPSNVMVTRNGCNVRLIDFGLADADFSATLKQPGGTENYMSPEQRKGSLPDIRNDIYSLGRIFEDMGMGKDWYPIVNRCLQPIEKRYRNLDELREDLRRMERRKWRNAILAVAFGCLLCGVLWYWHANRPLPQIFHDMTAWTYREKQCFEVTNSGSDNTIRFCGIEGHEPIYCPINVRRGRRYKLTTEYSTGGYEKNRIGDGGFQIYVREGIPHRVRNNSGLSATWVLPPEPTEGKEISVWFTATSDQLYIRMQFGHIRDSVPCWFRFDNWRLEEVDDIEGAKLDLDASFYLQHVETGLLLKGGGPWETMATLGTKGVLFDVIRCGGGYIIDSHEYDPGDGLVERYFNFNYFKENEGYVSWIDGHTQVWYFIPQEDGTYKLTTDGEQFLTYDTESPYLQMLPEGSGYSNRWRIIKRSKQAIPTTPSHY